MAEKTPAQALLKAAKSGNIARLHELLAAGAPLECTDLNRMTPVMLAARAGHAEAFQVLTEHGADLDAMALDQTDLLECAAEGGRPEIVQFLIGRGLPLEGHWRPRSRAEGRIGHITPLLMAAINGHVEAVRLLLKAGANPQPTYDDQTAQEMVEESIKYPLDAAGAERVPRLREIVSLLVASCRPTR